MKKLILTIVFIISCLAIMPQFCTNAYAAGIYESESNNTLAKADYISCGSTVNGCLSRMGDLDYYRFKISDPGSISIRFCHQNLFKKSSYWKIELYNASGKSCLSFTSLGMETSKTSLELGLPAGEYYVKVKAGSRYSEVAYQFVVNYKRSSVWETETNNTMAEADNINVNTVYYGALQYGADVDYYAFRLPSAGKISLNFAHTYIADKHHYWTILLYNNRIEQCLMLDSYGLDTNKSSGEIGLPAGTYYVKVKVKSSYYYNDSTYQLKVNYSASSVWETEKNDNVDSADSIRTNTTYYGALQYSSDKDYYRFTLPSMKYVKLRMGHTWVGDSRKLWVAKIFDKSLNTCLDLYSFGTDGEKTSMGIYLPAGTYYIKIVDDYYSNVTYSFSVLAEDPAPSVGTNLKADMVTYKVTRSGYTGGTVEYVKTTSKDAKVKIPDIVKINGITYKVTSIASNAFKNNKRVTKVTIGNYVTKLGASTFYGCSKLKTVSIGKNVLTIGDKAFFKCVSLTKILIPSKVNKIGKQAFYGCKKLKSITIKTAKLTRKKVGSSAFKGIYSRATIKVPSSKRQSYKKILKTAGAGIKIKIK